MRADVEYKRFSSAELFHIPFEHRGRVSSQRYSIPGLPCLYLGASTYVCWEELGRPAFSSVYVMALQLRDPSRFKVLDLAVVPHFVPSMNLIQQWQASASNKQAIEDYLVALVVCWPLMAACSTRVMEPRDPFKPEYVVPQLLLQWIRQSNNLQGVRYFSTKVGNVSDPRLGANYVIPARVSHEFGHCPTLKSLFEVTTPWNWEATLAAPPSSLVGIHIAGDIEIAPGSLSSYNGSKFNNIDGLLCASPFKALV